MSVRCGGNPSHLMLPLPPPLSPQVQRLSDKYMADLEDVFVQKEKDILAVS